MEPTDDKVWIQVGSADVSKHDWILCIPTRADPFQSGRPPDYVRSVLLCIDEHE